MKRSKHFYAFCINRTTYDTLYIYMIDPWILERKYENNTGKYLWDDLIEYTQKTFPTNDIKKRTDEDNETCLWWCQQDDSMDFLADKVMSVLDEFVETRVLPYKVPTLLNLVCKTLVHRPSFATAIMEHQRIHGYSKTDSVLYTYFHDILGNEIEAQET